MLAVTAGLEALLGSPTPAPSSWTLEPGGRGGGKTWERGLSGGDLAIETPANFQAVAEHRLVPAQAREVPPSFAILVSRRLGGMHCPAKVQWVPFSP